MSNLRCHRLTFASRSVLVMTALLLLGGCERPRDRVSPESATAIGSPAPSTSATRRASSGWNDAAGPALLVQGATRDEAIVLFPAGNDSAAVVTLDSVSLSEVPVTLLGRGGVRFSAQLGAPTGEGSDDCERWPLHAFQPSGQTATAWSVGFVGARVTPLPLDSVQVLTPRDSMTLAAEASRLASSVALATSPTFQGLRFAAQDVRRFEAAPGVQAMVALLTRRVNQEASPQQEQTLLIAERDSGVTTGPYTVAYAERSAGREEDVITPEVLAAVRLGPSAVPTLIIARDGEEGIAYTMVERSGRRQWRVRWSSGVTSCG